MECGDRQPRPGRSSEEWGAFKSVVLLYTEGAWYSTLHCSVELLEAASLPFPSARDLPQTSSRVLAGYFSGLVGNKYSTEHTLLIPRFLGASIIGVLPELDD